MKTIDLHIIDIVHNSIRAGADEITIKFKDSTKIDLIELSIIDNGSGIDPEKLEKIKNQYFSSRKERNIGLGLALLKYHAELCGGQFSIESEIGKGTRVYAFFIKSHIDRQPVGDLAGCITSFICQYPDINFIFNYITDNSNFSISSNDIKNALELEDLNKTEIIKIVKDLICENIETK
ncbi:MAG: ATP-binding protein [Bacteroidales bacterium]|jgi:anti-sigma regulatory factor (Ser/Thr protein kinase)